MFAAGLRNTQEIAFDEHGDLVAVDNDGDYAGELERVVYITRGSDVVIGTEDVGPSQPTRARLHDILYWAWETLGREHDSSRTADVVLPEVVAAIAKSASDDALRRTAYERRIDLVSDLAAQAAYGVIAKLYGVPAPPWLTELAASLRFAHQHVGEVPPEWIAKLIDKAPDNPGLNTLQL